MGTALPLGTGTALRMFSATALPLGKGTAQCSSDRRANVWELCGAQMQGRKAALLSVVQFGAAIWHSDPQ
jgi:hypothetical protein